MLTLLRAVKPQVRKKMLLQKSDTFDKAVAVLLSEEQASSDATKCTNLNASAETFVTSAYKNSQKQERQNFQPNTSTKSNTVPLGNYVCKRCEIPGHYAHECPAVRTYCEACGTRGHTAKACSTKSWNSAPTPAQANSVKAYLTEQSVNAKCIFNAQQIEKQLPVVSPTI